MSKQFTADELRRCAERELGMRRSVYERRVSAGIMTGAKAEREINMMQAIAEHFAELAEKEAATAAATAAAMRLI